MNDIISHIQQFEMNTALVMFPDSSILWIHQRGIPWLFFFLTLKYQFFIWNFSGVSIRTLFPSLPMNDGDWPQNGDCFRSAACSVDASKRRLDVHFFLAPRVSPIHRNLCAMQHLLNFLLDLVSSIIAPFWRKYRRAPRFI